MALINKESIELFKNLEEINDGFRIPDKSYIHGKDFECFEQLGADCYFSNYWYGEKNAVELFAEDLAQYFKKEYEKITPEEGRYDFYGLIAVWELGDKSMVANINIEEDLILGEYENYPKEIKNSLKNNKLKQLLSDYDDNSTTNLIYAECSDKIKKDLFSCVSENAKEDYLVAAEEEGIKIKSVAKLKK